MKFRSIMVIDEINEIPTIWQNTPKNKPLLIFTENVPKKYLKRRVTGGGIAVGLIWVFTVWDKTIKTEKSNQIY